MPSSIPEFFGICGILLEWQAAQVSANTTLPRITRSGSLSRYEAVSGVSFSRSGRAVTRKNIAMSGVRSSVARQ